MYIGVTSDWFTEAVYFIALNNEHFHMDKHRVDSRLAPSQWETSLPSHAVSHWLCTNLDSALKHSSHAIQLPIIPWPVAWHVIWCSAPHKTHVKHATMEWGFVFWLQISPYPRNSVSVTKGICISFLIDRDIWISAGLMYAIDVKYENWICSHSLCIWWGFSTFCPTAVLSINYANSLSLFCSGSIPVIPFRVTLLVIWQSRDRLSACEVGPKDMSKYAVFSQLLSSSCNMNQCRQ